jgi:methylglutaconyl-CoA hydratase
MVPPRILNEWCLTGERFDAKAALNAGLVNHVVTAAQLDEKVTSLSSAISANAPTAIRRGKYALESMHAMSFEQAIAFAEGQIALMAGTEDAREGLAAFAERREPRWTGR